MIPRYFLKTPKLNQKGQVALFVALIFQVLFVFFAMTINIGLLIHDKINLQNSVDLAAYYAASKQAEVLNAIAHSNYQIRQSWKLLAFRLWVLGSMGHVAHPSHPNSLDYRPLPEEAYTTSLPFVCIGYSFWQEQTRQTNLCRDRTLRIAELPRARVIFPAPWNYDAKDFTERMVTEFQEGCRNAGPPNWQLAVQWASAYRLDIGNRKRVIRELATLLTDSGPSDFKELNGESVFKGMRETFERNLTRANLGDSDATKPTLDLLNSVGGRYYKVWLNDMTVNPLIMYRDFRSASGESCFDEAKPISGTGDVNLPHVFTTSASARQQFDPYGVLQNARNEPDKNNPDYHSSLGFEKNPWFQVYVGVRASTKPRKPFAPFGRPIILNARAFAQPFGGRIGPWAKTQWVPSARESSGLPVDPLIPRIEPIEQDAAIPTAESFPNYSRFPGDKLGMRSQAALGRFRQIIRGKDKPFSITRRNYAFLPIDLSSPKGDILAWDRVDAINKINQGPREWGPDVRNVELAAIAPDLFDITYYSIDPNWEENYAKVAAGNFGSGVLVRSDLGSRSGSPYSVEGQIQKSKLLTPQEVFWAITDKSQVLTSWAPNNANDYSFPSKVFAKCYNQGAHAVPGMCAAGGRVGYSVRLVSRDYLTSSQLPLGGSAGGAGSDMIKGPLQNPPEPSF